MRVFIAAMLSMCVVACATSDVEDRGDRDDDALVGAVASELARVVAPGCALPTVCPGAKTCTPYTAFTTCSAPVTECCGFVGRNGHCSSSGDTLPQNRVRTCTMHATGATCVETQYRELSGCQTE